ncbi:uncharacterized protein DMAD_00438 [Drosophila madeirensis]|uniref:Uncharacterized protein n=1 Tax=Drosophila madeirensis TaxID=30013 RepID=A0AAU9FX48_DROMD
MDFYKPHLNNWSQSQQARVLSHTTSNAGKTSAGAGAGAGPPNDQSSSDSSEDSEADKGRTARPPPGSRQQLNDRICEVIFEGPKGAYVFEIAEDPL